MLAPLGAGGMGEVYRARDLTLRREVALKTLPKPSPASPSARAPAARSPHPRVAQPSRYRDAPRARGIGRRRAGARDGAGRGETLAERLHRGPLPLKEALAISQQITEALAAAHEKECCTGTSARQHLADAEGRIKLLDFGLARAIEEDEIDLCSQLSTATSPASDGRGVMGTAPYMSPEQARGQEVDRRTDIWSFGCVLYELLTGRAGVSGRHVRGDGGRGPGTRA